MSHGRRTDRWVRWATLMALALATLAPAVSHALHFARGDIQPWSLICSASGGMRRVQLPDAPELGQLQHAFEHCAACVLQLPAAPPPPLPATAVARSDLSQAAPTVLLSEPPTLRAWASAQPRGPPVC